MRMRSVGKKMLAMCLILGLLMGMAGTVPAMAADVQYRKSATAKVGWQLVNNRYMYFNYRHVKRTTMTRIGKTYYYWFNRDGYQMTGWGIFSGKYRFFRLGNCGKGYMVRSTVVNGIRIGADGCAVVDSSNQKKLQVLVFCSKIANQMTNQVETKEQKLKAMWDYMQRDYRYSGSLYFVGAGQWDVNYAYTVFMETHKGNCYALGAAFAYLGNAVGYTCAAVSSGGHGWAEVGGYVCDPTWAREDLRNNYYMRSYSLSGRNGSPNYARNRVYVRTI